MEKAMKKSIKLLLLACIFVLGLSFNVSAATPKTTTLQKGRTYKTFDLDGDGRKDSIRMDVRRSGSYAKGMLYINGKQLYSMQADNIPDYASLKVLTLKNGKNFVFCTVGEPDTGKVKNVLLQYKNKKIKVIDNFSDLDKYANKSYVNYIKFSGNSVYVTMTSTTWSLSTTQLTFRYLYSSGTLKKAKNIAHEYSYKSFTAAKNFYVYKKPGSSSTAFRVRTGESVTIAKLYRKSGALWLCVKNRYGKTGWVKGQTGYSSNGLFRTYYAS